MHPEGTEIHHEQDEGDGRGERDCVRLEVCSDGDRQILFDNIHQLHTCHNTSGAPLGSSHYSGMTGYEEMII